MKKKRTSDRHYNRLGEPDPRWEEGLEGSGKRQTVEPRRFECAWGDSTVLGGIRLVDSRRVLRKPGKGEETETTANSGKHQNCTREEISEYH